jgi:peptidyl-tRNA hydrolase, PTH1 family
MGLFQKKIVPIVTPQYSLGHQEIVLVVGLGNPGDEYTHTRHNAGFMMLDQFALNDQFSPWIEKKDLKSILCAKIIGGKKVILCKPTTYMNHSGEAVQLVQNFYKINDGATAIVYDELDLTLGTIRTARGGSSAGHNGIKSLIAHTQNESWRIRVGIGPKLPDQMDTADFVLQNFSVSEQKTIALIQAEVSVFIHEFLASPHDVTAHTRHI